MRPDQFVSSRRHRASPSVPALATSGVSRAAPASPCLPGPGLLPAPFWGFVCWDLAGGKQPPRKRWESLDALP